MNIERNNVANSMRYKRFISHAISNNGNNTDYTCKFPRDKHVQKKVTVFCCLL